MANPLIPFPGGRSGRYSVDNTGNGGNPPGMEARIARLESDVAHIQRDATDIKTDLRDLRKDVRQMIYFMIGGFIVLLGMMATGYVRLDEKIEAKTAKIEARVEKVEERLGKVESRLEKLDTKLDTVLERLPQKR